MKHNMTRTLTRETVVTRNSRYGRWNDIVGWTGRVGDGYAILVFPYSMKKCLVALVDQHHSVDLACYNAPVSDVLVYCYFLARHVTWVRQVPDARKLRAIWRRDVTLGQNAPTRETYFGGRRKHV